MHLNTLEVISTLKHLNNIIVIKHSNNYCCHMHLDTLEVTSTLKHLNNIMIRKTCTYALFNYDWV